MTYKQRWQIENKERINARVRNRWFLNPEKYRERCRRWAKKNRATLSEKNRIWRLNNPDRVKAYQEKDSPKRASRSRIWHAKRKDVTVGDLVQIDKIYARAKWLRQWFDVCVDHVVPLSRNGTHEVSNLQIIYASENRKKHDRLDYKPRVVFI